MTPDFYANNRKRLVEALSAEVVVIAAHDAMQLRGDQSIVCQEANFLYLTGIQEAGWRLVMTKNPYSEQLIAPQRDETQVLFEGGLTADAATALSGIHRVVTQDEGGRVVEMLALHHTTVACIGKDPHEKYHHSVANPSRARLERELKRAFSEVVDCRPALARLRAIKQPAEVALLRRAVAATAEGFRAVQQALEQAEGHEYELEAILSHAFRVTGAEGHAYEPIVAYGKNACILHYSKNDQPLVAGGLVLIDAGAQVGGYAADVTRTYAVGTATARQKQVHAAVETAHQALLQYVRPGISFAAYQEFVDETMRAALKELGLLRSDADYRRYFPHAIGHGLGLDVHESLGGYKELTPGMVLTVEPGIYISEEGIGVRIEDDILITKEGNEVLSGQLPTSLWYTSK